MPSPANLAAIEHARAVRSGTPAEAAATRVALSEKKVLAAIARADLTPESRDRVAAALLTDSVEEWLNDALAEAPRELTPATRSRIVRLLSGGGK